LKNNPRNVGKKKSKIVREITSFNLDKDTTGENIADCISPDISQKTKGFDNKEIHENSIDY